MRVCYVHVYHSIPAFLLSVYPPPQTQLSQTKHHNTQKLSSFGLWCRDICAVWCAVSDVIRMRAHSRRLTLALTHPQPSRASALFSQGFQCVYWPEWCWFIAGSSTYMSRMVWPCVHCLKIVWRCVVYSFITSELRAKQQSLIVHIRLGKIRNEYRGGQNMCREKCCWTTY